ncbi:MAG: serine hydrolase domain-containing protein [Planctomycetota bacterium]|jgi:CubicO group peptidase (beta-lactamase class C family)
MNTRRVLGAAMIALFGAAWAPSAWAQTDAKPEAKEVVWPDTPAGRWGKAFFEAFNTDGDDALREFIKEYYSDPYLKEHPLEKELAMFKQARMINPGGAAAAAVRADGDFVVVITYHSRVVGWIDLRIELSPDPPHDLAEMKPVRARVAPNAESPNYDDGDWTDLRDLVERVRRDARVPALAAAIVHGGKIVEKAVTGVRRFDRPDRVQIDDRFHLASVSKSWTATMIGKLVENGVLRWDITISEALPDTPMRAEYRGVTLHQLLRHRGRIPDLPLFGTFAEGFPAKPSQSPAAARTALVRQVLTEEPCCKPDEYSYSNSGYVIAGCMAEHVAKHPWEELMRSLVFEPLRLRSTGIGWPATEARPNQPHGHLGSPPDLSVQEIGQYPLGDINCIGPAGNVHSSIEDFARYAALHLQGLHGRDGVLKAETVRHLHTPPADGNSDYAYGWHIRKTDAGEPLHEHLGGGGTFVAWIALYPDSDLAIVASANRAASVTPYLKKMRDAIYWRMKQKTGASRADDGVQWPDTIAARRAREFVKAINADDEESLRRFVAENYSQALLNKTSIEDKIALFQGMRAQMGKLTVSSVEPDREFSVVLVGKAEAPGIWGKFTIKVEKEPPHYWTAVTFLPTAVP